MKPSNVVKCATHYSASAEHRASPSSSISTWTTFGRQQTGQSSTYCWLWPCEKSIGITISSPHASQMYVDSSCMTLPRLKIQEHGPQICTDKIEKSSYLRTSKYGLERLSFQHHTFLQCDSWQPVSRFVLFRIRDRHHFICAHPCDLWSLQYTKNRTANQRGRRSG